MLASSKSKLSAAIAAGIGFPCWGARAIEAYDLLVHEVGPVLIKPSFSLTTSYESNMFYREEQKEDNLVLNYAPGFNVFAGEMDRSYVSLNYQMRGVQYLIKKTDPNSTPLNPLTSDDLNRIDHDAVLAYDYALSKFDINGRSEVEFIGGILTGSTGLQRTAVNRLRQQHDFGIKGEVTPKIRGTLRVRYDATNFENDSDLYDRNSWRTTLGLNYDAFARNFLISEIYYSQRHSKPNSGVANPTETDVNAIGGFIGAQGEFTPKIRGEVRVGYEASERSDSLDTPEGVIGEITLAYQITPKNSLELSYNRRYGLSVDSGSSGYASNQVDLSFLQQIGTTGQWLANITGGFLDRDYVAGFFDNRKDKYYTASVGLTYRIRDWLTSGVSYQFAKFDTNASGRNSYDIHRVSLTMTIGY